MSRSGEKKELLLNPFDRFFNLVYNYSALIILDFAYLVIFSLSSAAKASGMSASGGHNPLEKY